MNLEDLFGQHLGQLDRALTAALDRAARAGAVAEGVVFHSGTARLYHADDQEVPFRTVPHFARWVPLAGPDHLIVARPESLPHLIRTTPRDFWYEAPAPLPEHCQGSFEVSEVESLDAAVPVAGDLSAFAYVGDSPSLARRLGIPPERVEPEALLAPLDWDRAVKTPYEVACLREAVSLAARGHRAAREAFAAGASEKRIHDAYLEAAGITETESPFPNIVALDDRAATLHYQNKRKEVTGRLVLVDAGASARGYASDVTRTYLSEDEQQGPMGGLLDAMDELQRTLVSEVRPGRPFLDLHRQAHHLLAGVLIHSGLLRTSAEEAVDRGLTRPFLPHGLGHHLGLQVHDVGGQQASPDGGKVAPPEEHAFLRNTRTLEPGHCVTIEPGLYFIRMLLEPVRQGPDSDLVDWSLVDRLAPYGGIRIEDDILVTEDGGQDLTRPSIPGHRD